jgi:ATP-dependent DNA helicase RecQ
LAAVGVEQFVVPDTLAPQVSEILAQSTARIGLVLGHGEWVGPPETSLARLPTAVLLPPDDGSASRLLARCRAFFAAAPGIAVAVVARPERKVDDRRLDQTVSRLAPYSEEWLESLAAPGEEVA